MRGPGSHSSPTVRAVPRRRSSWARVYGQRPHSRSLPSCWSAHAGPATRRRAHPRRQRPRRRACRASGIGTRRASEPAASPSAAADANLPAVPTGYTELDAALGADKPFNGKKVSIQTQWTGGEGEGFAAAIKDFAAATGIAVQVDSIGSSHETVLKTRIEGGSPPDMAALAQPTGVLAYAKDGKVIDVATFMDPAKLKADSRRRSASPATATISGASRPRPTSSR